MDWFERLTGFPEGDYESTRDRLTAEGDELVSLVSGQRHGIGRLEMPSLMELRERTRSLPQTTGRLRVLSTVGDARRLHQAPPFGGALFQVASQFNLLEMVSPDVTPEDGVGRYAFDRTQGPACAMAAGAATIYRNYLVPVAGRPGQTATHQLDALADLGRALESGTGYPQGALWTMRNGYAMCSSGGLQAMAAHLGGLSEPELDLLRGQLRIGLHHEVEVTDHPGPQRPKVSQAFCSALPVAYGRHPEAAWRAFATLVLEAAYEATLTAALLNAAQGGTNVVLLTRLGGGAFGNRDAWIDAAIHRALLRHRHCDLEVRLVSHGRAHPSAIALEKAFG